jgi:hypothetical protein
MGEHHADHHDSEARHQCWFAQQMTVATIEPGRGNVEVPSIGAAFAAPQTQLDIIGVWYLLGLSASCAR